MAHWAPAFHALESEPLVREMATTPMVPAVDRAALWTAEGGPGVCDRVQGWGVPGPHSGFSCIQVILVDGQAGCAEKATHDDPRAAYGASSGGQLIKQLQGSTPGGLARDTLPDEFDIPGELRADGAIEGRTYFGITHG